MWPHEIEATNLVAMFRNAAQVDLGAVVLHDIIIEHLSQLDDKLKHYFQGLVPSNSDLIRNPFHVQVDMSSIQRPEKDSLLKIFLFFTTTYMYEKAFSSMTVIKTTQRVFTDTYKRLTSVLVN
ncbi:hypothetical protein RF11_02777 [Thelohanellus kitauei]|uniref:Uncharacterized protein n=1 Tax=Thelohanellus kitauei TaxID=669202 RepID=A0A0C2MH20_THEKT|nr:hypothetical protein RF11_02777 [Thelohanellus kitauei]